MKIQLLRLTAGLSFTLLAFVPLAKAEEAEQGVFDQLAAVTGSVATGVTPAGTATQGAATQGAATQGAATQGAATQGAATQGAATQGAATQGAPVQGPANQGPATQGAAGGAPANGGAVNLTAELQKQPGVEPQLKGAVHEAFAEPVTEPKPGPVVAKEPPKDIEELPAAQKPDGEDVQWYGGYWDFDQDRTDFVWTSGIYRKPPPRRQWTAGSWVKVDSGWQRQRGMWLTLDVGSITFLSSAPPPAQVEEAANTPPDNKSVFVPGNYEYKETSYVWKPGKWVPTQENWIWIPAHYVWTPCGYVFVAGYWDFLMEKRGLLFAPVCIDLAYVTPGWTYTPCCVIHNTCMQDALFVRPGCGYFFGSYFQNPAYTSWPDFCVAGKVCDPMFAYYKLHRKGNWEHNLKALYNGRRDGSIASPPSNVRELNKFVQDFKSGKINANQVRHSLLIGSTGHLNANVLKLQNLDKGGVQNQKKFSDQVRDAGRTLGQKQTQFLSSRGSQNGSQVLKLDVDKSVTSRFRSNNGSQGNGNGQSNSVGKVFSQPGNTGINRSNGLGNGSNNQNKVLTGNAGNNGTQVLNKNGNTGFTPRSNSVGSGSNNGSNGGANNANKVLTGNNGTQVLSKTGNTGINPRSNSVGNGSNNQNKVLTGNAGNNGTQVLNKNGNTGFTPRTNSVGNGSNNQNKVLTGNGGNNSGVKVFQGTGSGSSGLTPRSNSNGNPGNFGSGSGSNNSGASTPRRFESGNNGSSFQQSNGNSGNSGFSARSFQSNQSFQGSQSFQKSSSGGSSFTPSFRSNSGSGGGGSGFGGGNSGGGGGRRR